MRPVRCALAFVFLALASLAGLPAASAQYYSGGCSPGYCPPSYSRSYYGGSNHSGYGYTPRYRNIWSDWAYTPWSGNPSYFTRHRTFYDDCGHANNEYDSVWLYARYWHGGRWCYERHCRIGDYAGAKGYLPLTPYVDAKGATDVAYDAEQYALFKLVPGVGYPGALLQKTLPLARSANEFLPPLESTRAARVENAHKADISAKDFAAKVFLGEQQLEAQDLKIRGELATLREDGQQQERASAELRELIRDYFAHRNAGKLARAAADKVGIEFDPGLIKSPELASLLNERCVSCHGPTKQAGDLDFRDYATFDAKRWRTIRFKCENGDMPKDGEPLDDAHLELLDAQVEFAKSRAT